MYCSGQSAVPGPAGDRRPVLWSDLGLAGWLAGWKRRRFYSSPSQLTEQYSGPLGGALTLGYDTIKAVYKMIKTDLRTILKDAKFQWLPTLRTSLAGSSVCAALATDAQDFLMSPWTPGSSNHNRRGTFNPQIQYIEETHPYSINNLCIANKAYRCSGWIMCKHSLCSGRIV